MMKKLKTILIMSLICVLLACSVVTCFATDTTNIIQATESNMDQILIDNDFDSEQVELMNTEDKLKTAEVLLINPDLVQTDSTISEINELEAIEKLINTPYDELVNQGVDKEFINGFYNLVDFWNDSSDEELMEIYDRDAEEIQLLRLACSPKETFEIKEITSTEVTSSDSISKNQLYFGQSCYKSTLCNGKSSYRVTWTFEWYKLPFMDLLTDEIAVAWGGELNTNNPTSDFIYYYHQNWTNNGGKKHYSAHYVEGPTDAGYRFWTHQSQGNPLTNDYHQLWKGSASLTLTQNGKSQGKSTKILSQYGHGVFAPNSVSITYPPAISFGSGWDYSEQKSSSIKY